MPESSTNLSSLRDRLLTARAEFDGGRLGEAAAQYRDILLTEPHQPDALHMLGVIAYRMGRLELSLQLYDEALAAVPSFALAWSNRALILRVLERREEALISGRKAIASNPRLADGWDITGLLLRERQEYQAACEHHARAHALDPCNMHMANNYAIALATEGRLYAAHQIAQENADRHKDFAIAELTLANILSEAGWPLPALAHFRKAAALDPLLKEAQTSEGHTLLQVGEFATGWEKLEARSFEGARFQGLARWRGEKIRHLLVHAEQGAGDIAQFIRYVPLIRARAQQISLEVPPALVGLIGAQFPDLAVSSLKDHRPEADAFVLLMSLPCLLGTTIETIPSSLPYLKAPLATREPWRERLAPLKRPKIGIVWMGNPLYANDHNRSLAYEEIRPLIELGCAHFVSLQKGSTTAAAAFAPLFDADPWLESFADTAGLIEELDLIIAADTAVAHLAGALGKPVWTLLPFTPDWRWMLGREDSPWYPGLMRLFRQRAPRAWGEVIERVRADLRKFLLGDRSVLEPLPWDGRIHQHNADALALAHNTVATIDI